jgi:hypothetical protein
VVPGPDYSEELDAMEIDRLLSAGLFGEGGECKGTSALEASNAIPAYSLLRARLRLFSRLLCRIVSASRFVA